VENITYNDGAASYTVFRRNPEVCQLALGEIFKTKQMLDKTRISCNFKKKSYIYNVREGKYLGYTDKISAVLNPYEPLIYARLPYKLLKIDIKAKTGKPGNILDINIYLLLNKGKSGRHVLHLDLISPDGKKYDYYSRNIICKGNKINVKIPMAFNDPTGKWKIIVKDIATGVRGEKKILLKI
jgi:hypothetical protein